MKVVLLYVASVDGKITKWGQSSIHEWTSIEDAAHFQSVLNKSKLVVMGSSTFRIVKPKPIRGTLRVVMTREPLHYKKSMVPGMLEFSNETPEQLVRRFTEKGFSQLTLVSGRNLTTVFFQKKLIDELWLTIEPRIFGRGDPLVSDEMFDISLRLVSIKRLNEQGTLLVKYKVIK